MRRASDMGSKCLPASVGWLRYRDTARRGAWGSQPQAHALLGFQLGFACTPGQDGYGRRAEQLDLKERELRAKEAELRKLETDLRATGALRPEKNWPRCCPFTHHDIAGEVGAHPAASHLLAHAGACFQVTWVSK